jgi:hypothetical protein
MAFLLCWIFLAILNRYLLSYYIKSRNVTGKVENYLLFFLYIIPPVGTFLIGFEMLEEKFSKLSLEKKIEKLQKWLKGEQ